MKGVIETFFRFKAYFKDYIFHFCVAIFGMILASAGTAASAYLVKPVLDQIFVDKNKELLYLLPYAIIAVYFAKSLGTYLQSYFSAYIGHDIVRRFRARLLAHLIYLDMSFFNRYRSGELISRNTNDIERIRSIVSSMLPELGREFITALGLLGVVIYQSPKLALFALIIFPVAIYPLSLLARKIKQISKLSQEKTSDMTAALSEIFSNIEIIKANNAENKEITRFNAHNDRFFRLNLKSVRTGELVSPLMETLGAIGVAVVIIIGGSEVINGTMSVGSFFSFLTALFMLYTPIKRVSSLYNKMQDAVAASERTFELLGMNANIVGGMAKFPSKLYSIAFNDVHFSYDNKNFVLNGLSFRANSGEIIAIIGQSGGGKTTIINLLMRFFDANSGQILINQNEITDFSLNELRAHIGIVTQRIYIFNDTIAANVAYSQNGKIDEERVIKALEIADAYSFVRAMEGGIYAVLDEFGANLSGGQRQRIAIARALYANPQILIFDEATSALDNESERIITDVIERIKHEKIIFVIAHRQTSIKNANKILFLSQGRALGFGSNDELEQNCQEYKKLKELAKI